MSNAILALLLSRSAARRIPVLSLQHDFTLDAVGAASLPSWLTGSRASGATVQTGAATLANLSNNQLGIGGTGVAGIAGLLLEPQSVNALSNTNLGAWTLDGMTRTASISAPDGSTNAFRFQGNANQQAYFSESTTQPAGSAWWSCWARTPTGNAAFDADIFNAGNAHHFGGSNVLTSNWQWLNFNVTGLLGVTTWVVGLIIGYVGIIPAGARDAHMAFPKVEFNVPYPHSYFPGTMAAARLYAPRASDVIVGGRCRLQVELGWRYSSATLQTDTVTPRRTIWRIDNTNFVEIDGKRLQIRAVVNGVHVLFPTALSWNAGDVLRIRVDVGNGTPSGWVQKSTDGGVTFGAQVSLGTIATSQGYIRTEDATLDLFHDSSTMSAHIDTFIRSIKVFVLSHAAPLGQTIYVSPTGTGVASGTKLDPASIDRAVQIAQSLLVSGPVTALMRDGNYYRTTTLALTNAHSGLTFQRYPGENPFISGGVVVTGWADDGSGQGVSIANCSTPTRQLFVKGARATRARSALIDNTQWASTSTGFTAPDATIAGYARPTDVQIVGRNQWRWIIDSVQSAVGTAITCPSAQLINDKSHPFFLDPTASPGSLLWWENARELITSSSTTNGYWYQNRSTNKIYYRPNTGENLATDLTVVGSLQTLISITGIAGTQAAVSFVGIGMGETTWLEPDTNGYADMQSPIIGDSGGRPPTYAPSDVLNAVAHKVPGAVVLRYAGGSVFAGCTFTRTGAVALAIEKGTQGAKVLGCSFIDTAAEAITIGDASTSADWSPSSTNDWVSNTLVQDCYFFKQHQDYAGGASLFIGFADHNVIDHCEFADTTQAQTASGWGWMLILGNPVSLTDGNQVTNSLFYNSFLNVRGTTTIWMADFGECYWLANEHGGICSGNYFNVPGSRGNGQVYLDGGCNGVTVDANVMGPGPSWVFFQPSIPDARGNTVTNNRWASNPAGGSGGTNNTLSGNVNIASPIVDATALAIILAAGRR